MGSQHSTISLVRTKSSQMSPSADIRYVNPLNKALKVFFKEAVTVSLKDPSQALYFLRVVRNQQRSNRIRAGWLRQGIRVPPIIIFSITNRCNLHCKGCYHHAIRDITQPEMGEEKLRSVIAEARDLGVSFMVLAGGEPLVRRDILNITRDFPEIIFFMFTNGLLITDEMVARFKAQRNIVPLISQEGYETDTDGRRGDGVYERLQGTIRKLKNQDVFFGTSLTLTRNNFDITTGEKFIQSLNGLGCKLLLFVEYTPIKGGTEDWVITSEQRIKLSALLTEYRRRHSTLFVSVPGDEKDFGGCLSAGRGFVHISAGGDVEPCPFAPYSDSNLSNMTLKEALQSNFLKAVRASEDHLDETGGSCALFTRRDWVQSLLSGSGK